MRGCGGWCVDAKLSALGHEFHCSTLPFRVHSNIHTLARPLLFKRSVGVRVCARVHRIVRARAHVRGAHVRGVRVRVHVRAPTLPPNTHGRCD